MGAICFSRSIAYRDAAKASARWRRRRGNHHAGFADRHPARSDGGWRARRRASVRAPPPRSAGTPSRPAARTLRTRARARGGRRCDPAPARRRSRRRRTRGPPPGRRSRPPSSGSGVDPEPLVRTPHPFSIPRARSGSAGRGRRRGPARGGSPRRDSPARARWRRGPSAPGPGWPRSPTTACIRSRGCAVCRSAGAGRRRSPPAVQATSIESGPSRWPPLTSTTRGPSSRIRRPASRMSSSERTGISASTSASGTFGRDDLGAGQQLGPHGGDRIRFEQPVPPFGDHHRIDDDVRKVHGLDGRARPLRRSRRLPACRSSRHRRRCRRRSLRSAR